MNIQAPWMIVILILCACPAVVQGDAAARPAAAQVSTMDIERWVQELGDEDFSVREKASEMLWQHGMAALTRLRELTTSKNPERSIRARDLVRKIEMRIFPDSDPRLLEIVGRFPEAMSDEKRSLLSELQKMRAWRQMLKLYAAETDPGFRNTYFKTMQSYAVHAARQKLVEGDAKEAREYLEMAPVSSASLLSLAEFHRSHGTLTKELQKAQGRNDPKSAAWRMALHRASGDFKSALAEARVADDPVLASALAALLGDPLPWLRRATLHTDESRRLSNLQVRGIYAGLAAQRWQDQRLDSQSMASLQALIKDRGMQSRACAMMAMFMLGETQAAEATMVKENPVTAMRHFLALERIDDGLRALGVDPQKPCTGEWVAAQVNSIKPDDFDDISSSHPHQVLIAVAGFLESRGMVQHAIECYRQPLLELAETDMPAFMDFISKLYSGSTQVIVIAPMLATEIGKAWAGEDEERWQRLMGALFQDHSIALDWWKHLAQLAPETPAALRLDALNVLLRVQPDANGQREQWLKRAWNAYDKAAQDQKSNLLKLLADLSFITGSVSESQLAWKLLPDEMRNRYYWRQQVSHLSAENRWQEVCDILLEKIELSAANKSVVNPAFHAYAAAALRRIGDEKRASHHDGMVDKLTLGDSSMAGEVAEAYAFGDDRKRAMKWWLRAVSHADPANNAFATQAADYVDKILLEQQQWPVAAALAEVAACESIATSYYNWQVPLLSLHHRLKSDTMHALCKLSSDRRKAMAMLDQVHQQFINDGSLADFFFPALRMAGLGDKHDEWFGESWDAISQVVQRYPKGHNTMNTAAWLAARAQRNLDAAEQYLRTALDLYPGQAAYLDTMAEIQFAKGRRADAIRWSEKAIQAAPGDAELRHQNLHFRVDPMPR